MSTPIDKAKAKAAADADFDAGPEAAAVAAADADFESGPELTPAPLKPVSQTESFVRGAGNSMSFGFGDEAAGAGAKLYSWLSGEGDIPRAATRGINSERSARTDYEVQRDTERDANKQAQEDNPWTYAGGQLTGGIVTSAVPISKAVAPAANIGTRLYQFGKAAAPLGALYGAGESEGKTDVDVAADSLQGGMTAAVTGPIVGETFHQVAKVPAAIKNYVMAKAGKAVKPAPIRPEVQAAYGDRLDDALAMTAPDKGGQSLRDLARRGADPQVIEDYAKQLDDKLGQIWAKGDKIKWEEDISQKGKLVTKLLQRDGVNPEEAIRQADDVALRLEMQLHELGTHVSEGTPDANVIKKILKEVKEYKLGNPSASKKKDLAAVTPFDVAGDKFLLLDQVKREMQHALDSARSRGDSLIVAEVDNLAEGLREYLQNPHVWGEGSAALQQIRNQAWRERLLMKSRKGDPNRLVMSDATYEPSMDKYRPAMKGDPASLMAIVQNMDKFGTSTEVRALSEYANREAKLLKALTDHIDADPDLLRAAAEAEQLANEVNALISQRTKEAIAAKRLSNVGQPVTVPPGQGRQLMESIPILGPGLRYERAQQEVPNLQEQARLMQHFERVLGIDPKNQAAKKALENILSGMNSMRVTPSRGAANAARLAGYPAGAFTAERERR